ncbi:MAG: PIN domain-containing protein [Oscillospiraceae bacterium]|nr:PIN domain-containing protein [Oscillospiraceae bacterium]
MRLFLIDYENVNAAGLRGIGQADRSDRIILFYSHAANTLSFEIMDEMMDSGIMPERVCLEHTGKNALDFQLVTFLGYLIAKEKADSYYIISKDFGFQSAIRFCQEYFGVKVHLCPSIKSAIGLKVKKEQKASEPRAAVKPQQTPQKVKPEKQTGEKAKKAKRASVSLRKKTTVIQVQPAGAAPVAVQEPDGSRVDLDTVLSLVKPKVNADIAAEILHCLQSSHSKIEFHNALQQHFDNAIVKQYYHCMKPCFVAFTG